MISLRYKTESQLRALICFYERRGDRASVRTIENEIQRRSGCGPPEKRREAKPATPPEPKPLEGKPDPGDCAHDWFPMERSKAADRYRCRLCEAIGWYETFHAGRVRVYICQHQGCERPVQGINTMGGRYCREHYFDKPLI